MKSRGDETPNPLGQWLNLKPKKLKERPASSSRDGFWIYQWLKPEATLSKREVNPLNVKRLFFNHEPLLPLEGNPFSDLLDLILPNVEAQSEKLRQLNPSRRQKLAHTLSQSIGENGAQYKLEELLELRHEEPWKSSFNAYFTSVALISFSKICLWHTAIQANPTLGDTQSGITKTFSWRFSQLFINSQFNSENKQWNLLKPSLYSWYEPSIELLEICLDSISAHSNPSLLKSLLALYLKKVAITPPFEPQDLAKTFNATSRFLTTIFKNSTSHIPFKEVSGKLLPKSSLFYGDSLALWLYPHLSEVASGLKAKEETPLYLEWLFNHVVCLQKEGFESIFAEILFLFLYIEKSENKTFPPTLIPPPIESLDLSLIQYNSQLNLLAERPNFSQTSLIARKKYDYAFAFFSNSELLTKVQVKEFLKRNPHLRTSKFKWTQDKLYAYSAHALLREKGTLLLGGTENWFADEGRAFLKELPNLEKDVQCLIDCSQLNYTKELESTAPPKFLYIIQKHSNQQIQTPMKIVRASGEAKTIEDFEALIQSLCVQFLKHQEMGESFEFGPNEHTPFKLQVFTTKHHSPLISTQLDWNPNSSSQHKLFLEMAQKSSAKLGQYFHLFEPRHSKKPLPNLNELLALVQNQTAFEFLPAPITSKMTSKSNLTFLYPAALGKEAIHFALGFLNSRFLLFWKKLNGMHTTLTLNEIRMLPFPRISTAFQELSEGSSIQRIKKNLMTLNTSGVEESIKTLLNSNGVDEIALLISTLQKEWERLLLIINRYSRFFNSNPILSYNRIQHENLEVSLEKILPVCPTLKVISLERHPDILIRTLNSENPHSFEIKEAELIKHPLQSAEWANRSILKLLSIDGRHYELEAASDFIQIAFNQFHANANKHLTLSEFLQITEVPLDLTPHRNMKKEVQETTQKIISQMVQVKIWIDEAVMALYFKGEITLSQIESDN